MVQWLRLYAFTTGGMGLIHGWGAKGFSDGSVVKNLLGMKETQELQVAKIQHAAQCGQKTTTKKRKIWLRKNM